MTHQKTPLANHRLLIFAKAPVIGKVKTRLQPEFTPQQSLIIHRRLVEHVLNTAVGLPRFGIELWVSDNHRWWPELASRYAITIHQQQGENLGERMANALGQSLQSASKAVIIGSDCPFISSDYLRNAFDQLDQVDVVLGPADDGGYVLLGLNRPQPALFEDIDWGTGQVLRQTVHKAVAMGLRVAQLLSLMDIDRAEDVQQLHNLLPALVAGIGD